MMNGRLIEGSSASGRAKHRAWRADVAAAACARWAGRPPIKTACAVDIEFVLPRPKSARKTQTFQAKKPDLDKLVRATLDGLVVGGVIADDGLVSVLAARKVLVGLNGGWIGATVTVTELGG